jgi:ribonuclease HI
VLVYTDGSKTGERLGWGAVALDANGTVTREAWGPAPGGTVFDAEAMALYLAVYSCAEDEGPVFFFSDNASLVQAVQGRAPVSSGPKVCATRSLLKEKGWTVHWVPGHYGILGNELADALAKKGAAECHPETIRHPTPGGALMAAKAAHRAKTEEWWEQQAPKGYRSLGVKFWRPGLGPPRIGSVDWNFRRFSAPPKAWWKEALAERTHWGWYQATLDKMGLEGEARCPACDEPRELRHFESCKEWKDTARLVLALSGRARNALDCVMFGQYGESMAAGVAAGAPAGV